MERTSGYYSTFVVKIWCDGQATRGHIRHVGTSAQMRFLSLADITPFIAQHLVFPSHDSLTNDDEPGRPAVLNIRSGDISQHE